MKFDNKKVNSLLAEMEVILARVTATNKEFHEALAKKKQQAA